MPSNLIEVFTNTYGPYGVFGAIEGAAQAGLSHVELALKAHSLKEVHVPRSAVVTTGDPPDRVRLLQEHLDRQGISVVTCNGGGDLRDDQGFQDIQGQLQLAHTLGARIFVLAGAQRDTKVMDRLLELADQALRLGIVIALETHPDLVTNAEAAIRTMKDLQHRNLRINLDTANVYYFNDEADAVRDAETLAEYIAHVHVKDSRMRKEDWYFPALGEGSIDLGGVFRVLNDAGFYGPFGIELEGIDGEGQRTRDQVQARVESSVRHLQSLGVA